jgi:hypothetical protein
MFIPSNIASTLNYTVGLSYETPDDKNFPPAPSVK